MKKTFYSVLIIFCVIGSAFGQRPNDTLVNSVIADTLTQSQTEIEVGDFIDEFSMSGFDQQKAAMLLNECIYTLTRVERNKNKFAYEEEQFKLNNVLTWEGVPEMESVTTFREQLQTELNKLVINEIEKERFLKKKEKRDNAAARNALLGAVSSVQLNVNLVSIISNVVLTTARTLMDYNAKKEESAADLNDQLWELTKDEMKSVTSLRNTAFGVLTEAFGKFGIKECMRLTPDNVNEFLNILELKDLVIKQNQLQDKESVYQFFPPYWYELGCTYLDLYSLDSVKYAVDLQKAWKAFDRYERMSDKFKLYRYDGNVGMIALFQLQYQKGLSNEQKEALIQKVMFNIKNNGNVYLICALNYMEMGKLNESYRLMSDCLSNNKMTASDEMILTSAAYWYLLKDQGVKDYFVRALALADNIGVNAYLTFLYAVRNDKNVDFYTLRRVLQKNIQLVPIRYEDDDITEIEYRQSDNTPRKFYYNIEDWDLVRRDFYNDSDDRTDWEAAVRKATHKLKDDYKYFDSPEAMAHEMYYFKDHPDHLYSSEGNLFSIVMIDGKKYYYLDASKKWESGIKDYQGAKIEKKKGSGRYNTESNNREDKYRKFYKKYSVEKVESVFYFGDYVNERYSWPGYTGPICIMDLSINSGDNDGEYYNGKVCLRYETDYIKEGDTKLRLCGISFVEKVGDEEKVEWIKF
jgi:hypothetical protein